MQSKETFEDSIDSIIGVLNTTKPYQKAKIKPMKKQKIPQQIIIQNIQNNDRDIDSLQEFQKIYELKIKHDNKKKLKKQQQLIKKQEVVNINKQEVIQENKQIIRYLQFKNWSGNVVVAKDYGYKFKFSGGAIGLIKNLLQENGFIQSPDNDFTIIWNNGVPKPETFQSLGAYQKINHFPKSYQITRKDLMHRNIWRMNSKHGNNHFNFIPRTYILPSQTSNFIQDSQKLDKFKSNHEKQWYIIKPHNQSQGKGIWITDKVQQILKKQKDCIVVSHYINNPLLINNLKFDMRIYVGITCFNPLRIYMYQQGLARFATYQYSKQINSKENPYVHLTNYSLNKFSDQFVANQDQHNDHVGHKWALTALKQYLKNNGYDLDLIWGRIQDLVIKSILSIQNQVFSALQMGVAFRDNCFEILGFDVLIDSNLRPWLLEINLSPSMNTDSPIDLKIKGNMVADMFSLIGIVPIDQRFSVDKTYISNSNKASYQKDFKKDFAKYSQLVIKQSEQELKRARGWKRIFPTETVSRYKQFFDIDRPLNQILRQREQIKLKQNPNYNLAIKQLNLNPQNPIKKK